MARFVGIKNGRVKIISDKIISNKEMIVFELPKELEHLTNEEIILDCRHRDNQLILKSNKKQAKEIKVAFISNYKFMCGISSYAQYLYPEISKHIKNFKLFIEENDQWTGDIYEFGNQRLREDQVSICWKRGNPLTKLIKEVKEYNPDIILINFEYGLFPNAAYFMNMVSQLSDFKIICDMHSIYAHKDKTIVEACLSNIVVHIESAKKVLKEEKKINAKVSVIPHGCYPYDGTRLWNFYKTSRSCIQMGFLFRYKNFDHSIKAIALLKNKYPDIFLTLVCSEAPNAKVEHENYYLELVKLAQDLGVENNICFVRGYQSDEVINSFLRTNAVGIYPYSQQKGHECHGSSGAARLALCTGMPIITSSIPHFEDVPSLKAETPEEIAKHLDVLFSNPNAKKNQIEIQKKFAEETSFEKIALKYIELFENC